MAVASEDQRRKLAPVIGYFDRKRCEREEKDIWDRRFIASVLEVIRAEGEDQTHWVERRRHRCLAAGKQSCPSPRATANTSQWSGGNHSNEAASPFRKTDDGSPRSAYRAGFATTPLVQPPKERLKPPPNASRSSSASTARSRKKPVARNRPKSRKGTPKSKPEEAIDLTTAMTRVGQLKSSLSKAADPPEIALEMASLYLVLSDHRSALKSFRLAVKPSPVRAPTRQEKDKMEAQKRKLAILPEDRRAEALALLHAREVDKRRQGDEVERARIRRAATGIYLCLLELKQPVEAVGAAKLRLDMCETEDERRQVEAEIHGELLKRGGLLEPEATNQGAWLTESAGALSDLHASVLESLTGFKHDFAKFQRASPAAERSLEQENDGSTSRRWSEAWDSMDERSRQQGDDGCSRTEGDGYNATDGACAANRLKAGDGGAVSGRRKEAEPSCGVEEERDRTRLRELGRLLARKRQFTASRQAFDDAMRGDRNEVRLRERNRCHSRGYFVDMALREATPSIQLELDSRWQGGVATDEARRRALRDFTGFTGAHHGAETLVAAVPAGGWASGASELAYAERFSRTREAVRPLQWGDLKSGVTVAARSSLEGRVHHQGAGILLGYEVSGDDIAQP